MVEPLPPKLAFLGPLGSYSHQCAAEKYQDSVQYAEQPTIPDVFRAISEEIPFAVIPQENSVYGTVIDTYDALCTPEAGRSVFVRDELTLAVKHCLVVRRGVKLEDVQRVMSHEQALGQCTRFLETNLPDATRMKVPATSAAARAVLCCGGDTGEPESAAICSAHCAALFEGLEILFQDIQNEASNTTRFYVLANSMDTPLPRGARERCRQHALVRIGDSLRARKEDELPSPSRLSRLVIGTLLTTFGCPVVRVDRRPSLNDVPFDDVYFIELEGSHTHPISISGVNTGEEEWLQRIRNGIEGINAGGGEAVILGLW